MGTTIDDESSSSTLHSSTLSPHDPNYLATLLKGLSIANGETGRQKEKSYEPVVRRLTGRAFLDSLAAALVSETSHQVVAVGLIISAPAPAGANSRAHPPEQEGVDSALKLVIAQNGTTTSAEGLDSAYEHLKSIITYLKSAHAACPALSAQNPSNRIPMSCFPLEPTSHSPHWAILAQLELLMLRSSWKKICKRFQKLYPILMDIDKEVKDDGYTPDGESPNDSKIHTYLQNLRDCQHLLLIPGYCMNLYDILGLLKSRLATGDAPNDQRLDSARNLLHVIQQWTDKVPGAKLYATTWNQYASCAYVSDVIFKTRFNVSCTLLAREIKARQLAKTAEGENVRAHPQKIDLLYRLSKCFSVCTHFQRIANLVVSPRWSHLLLRDVQFEKVISTAPAAVPRFRIDSQGLQELLKDDYQSSDEDSKSALTPEDCFGKLAKALEMPRDTAIDAPFEGDTHCECLVLGGIHGHPSIPYIGASKHSCGPCAEYIEAYNKVMQRDIKTLGSHGENVLWRFPVLAGLPENINDEIRDKFCQRMRSLIVCGWRLLSAGSA